MLATALLEKHRRQNSGRLGLLAWTSLHRLNLRPGRPFDLTRHKYLRALYDETAREVVVYKASQLGASEYGISLAFWLADEMKKNVLYVFPTEGDVSAFSAARIGPAIETSPYLTALIQDGGMMPSEREARRRGVDRVLLKRVRDEFIYFRGGRVSPEGKAAQLKSIDADGLILDELDEMDARAPIIARRRLGHSDLKLVRWVSTPSYPGVGIHAKWGESDQRVWLVRCPACGSWEQMTIQKVVIEWDDLERPVAWHGGPDAAWVACDSCGAKLDRLADGLWVAQNRGSDLVGFHLTKFASETADLLEIVHGLQSTDETERQETFNQDLGQPYVPRGGRLTDEILDACRRQYAHGPVPRERTVAGVDVGNLLHVVIRGDIDRETGDRPQRFAGAVQTFAELARLFRRFRVRAAVVDALPETRKVREFQALFRPGVAWAAYFDTSQQGMKTSEPYKLNEKEYAVTIDRTRAFDAVMAAILSASNGEGDGITFPANIRDLPKFYAHLKAQTRVTRTNTKGVQVASYVESGPDHYSLAELYCTIAAAMPRAAALPTQSNIKKKQTWQ